MVCEDNGTFLDINIPSIMLPQSAGDTLEAGLLRDETGTFLSWLWILLLKKYRFQPMSS